VVPEPAPAWRKLREAWFFLWHLGETESKQPTPEEFDYFLSAFLSAARSVVYKVYFWSGERWKIVDDWKATRTADDLKFFDSMTGLRDAEVHNEGITTIREQEAAPMRPSFDERYSTRFAALLAAGMLGETTVYIDRHYINLEADRVKAVPACKRFAALVEDLLRYVDALIAKGDTSPR